MMDDLRRFSHSLIDTYLECPRKAMYRYVEQLPSPKTSSLVRGSACDDAWNYALQRKIEGEPVATADLLEVTEDAYRAVIDIEGGVDSVDWGDTNARESLDSALRLSRAWAIQLYPDIEPTAVQVRVTRELDSGRQFIGFLDFGGRVDGVPCVGDNKTGARRMSRDEASRGLQPFAYSWLLDEPTTFVFARAIDTGRTVSTEFVWTERSAGDNAWYGQLVNEVEAGFAGGHFPPNPKSYLCGPKHCPFYDRCMPHRAVRAGLPVALEPTGDLSRCPSDPVPAQQGALLTRNEETHGN